MDRYYHLINEYLTVPKHFRVRNMNGTLNIDCLEAKQKKT